MPEHVATSRDVSPMTENPPGKEVFIGDVLVNVGKLIDYAGETIKWPFEIRKRTTAGIEAHGKLHTQIIFDQVSTLLPSSNAVTLRRAVAIIPSVNHPLAL
eukprot:3136726-Rhodomonas_salina.1